VIQNSGFFIENLLDQDHHIALERERLLPMEPVMVRVHSQSTVDDVFYSCEAAAQRIALGTQEYPMEAKASWLYLRQEEKGSNSSTKSIYALQDPARTRSAKSLRA